MSSQKVEYNVALKIAIVESGLTQRRLALRTQIDETRLSRILHGLSMPTRKERAAIAKVLRRRIGQLFEVATVAA